jgi:hypothetical protein
MNLISTPIRKIFILLKIAVLFAACNSQNEAPQKEHNHESKVHQVSDPEVFIGKHRAKAMVLGLFHFHNPGLDAYKPKFPFNILEKKRQAELENLLRQIAAYQPTKILVEWDRMKEDSITNERFQKYLHGTFDLEDKTNEVYQIGFKLAKKLGHKKIYCSDAPSDWFGVEMDWDNYDAEDYLKSGGNLKKAPAMTFNLFMPCVTH